MFCAQRRSRQFRPGRTAPGLDACGRGQNVARLEQALDVRLFQRSTRKLSLTEAGEYFLTEAAGGLTTLQLAMGNLTTLKSQPAGTLKVSMGLSFGREYMVPLLGISAALPAGCAGLALRQPHRRPDSRWFRRCRGGGFDMPLGVVARQLAPAHRILLASPAYLENAAALRSPADLPLHAGILIRSPQTGRVRPWTLRNREACWRPSTCRRA